MVHVMDKLTAYYCLPYLVCVMVQVTTSYPSRLLCYSTCNLTDGGIVLNGFGRNVFDVGGSSTGSEEIGKHLKRQKEEGVEIVIICVEPHPINPSASVQKTLGRLFSSCH